MEYNSAGQVDDNLIEPKPFLKEGQQQTDSLIADSQPISKPPNPFANTPPLSNFPRLLSTRSAPTGPGYYSARDFLSGEYRQKPPPFPWGRISLKPFPFYDADFRYLKDHPKNTYFMWSDFMKRRRIGDEWLFSTGGEVRDRYMNEIDARLTPTVNRYEQLRTLVYGSLYHGDDFGVFAQISMRSILARNSSPSRSIAIDPTWSICLST